MLAQVRTNVCKKISILLIIKNKGIMILQVVVIFLVAVLIICVVLHGNKLRSDVNMRTDVDHHAFNEASRLAYIATKSPPNLLLRFEAVCRAIAMLEMINLRTGVEGNRDLAHLNPKEKMEILLKEKQALMEEIGQTHPSLVVEYNNVNKRLFNSSSRIKRDLGVFKDGDDDLDYELNYDQNDQSDDDQNDDEQNDNEQNDDEYEPSEYTNSDAEPNITK